MHGRASIIFILRVTRLDFNQCTSTTCDGIQSIINTVLLGFDHVFFLVVQWFSIMSIEWTQLLLLHILNHQQQCYTTQHDRQHWLGDILHQSILNDVEWLLNARCVSYQTTLDTVILLMYCWQLLQHTTDIKRF